MDLFTNFRALIDAEAGGDLVGGFTDHCTVKRAVNF
jgi:hypothetical protein